eukprot:m.209004 g.209004  ORF g.209004 m.209004 type:complete len:194 (+) comp39723_c0_seq21:1050-1631(+)
MAHLLFSYVIFVMNTAVFWGSEGTGERSLMIVCGSFFFVAAMGLMLLDDNVLDLGLNSAYSNISQKTGKFMESRGMTPWTLNGIGIVWKLSVGLGCAFLSAFLTFPGLRYAKGHLDVLSDHQHSSIISLLVNLSFFLPLFISLLWIQSLTKEPLVTNKMSGRSSAFVLLNVSLVLQMTVLEPFVWAPSCFSAS